MPKLTVRGRTVDAIGNGRTDSALKAEGLEVSRVTAVAVASVRDSSLQPIDIDAQDDDVLVLHLEGGFKLFTSYRDFRNDFPNAQRDGGGGFLLDPTLGVLASDRGAGSLLLKGLEVFHIKPHQSAALALAARIESHLQRPPGLYRLPFPPRTDASALPPRLELSATLQVPDPNRPALIFIHGTASSTLGAYAALGMEITGSPIDFRRELTDKYGDNIFGFEHKTLTVSPLHNALQLASELPAKAELHLVSHSRGGLVGDLLALGTLDDTQLKSALSFLTSADDQATLKQLAQVLNEKQFHITRYVRVACPARGTTLVSKRTDRWLSAILSLLGHILDHFANPVLSGLYEALQDFLLAVANEGLNPEALPGLASMFPTSPLIRMLNLSGIRTSADLSIVAGDTQGKTWLDNLKFVVPDLFYGGQHDLVVNYASMDGGLIRDQERIFSDNGPNVNHVSYFHNPSTRRALMGGLKRSDKEDGGYQKFERHTEEIPWRDGGVAGDKAPIVYIVPGIFGSELKAGEEKIWLDRQNLAQGGFEKLEIGAPNVSPINDGLLRPYQEMASFLARTHEVIRFSYDWRLSLNETSGILKDSLKQKLDGAGDRPVRIIAHSTGGLLVRAMFGADKDLWEKFRAHDKSGLIMLGTPNGGSYEIERMLAGQSRLIRQIRLLSPASTTDPVKILNGFPGLKDCVPGAPATTVPLAGKGVIYVAGLAANTPDGVKTINGQTVFYSTPAGDGRTPWKTGVLEDAKVYYSPREHGDLANHDLPALLELLQTGATWQLPQQPRAVRSVGSDPPPMPDEVDEVLPNERDLIAAALGSSVGRSTQTQRPAQQIAVRVVHGDLTFARHTVAVGHYAGDSIVGPEAVLDRQLDRRLSLRNQLGVYPDRVGSCEVFLAENEESRPNGAIVMGLGKVGDLKPKDLENTYYAAMLKYMLAAKECHDGRFQEEGRDAVSTVLVGTMANVLTIEECLTAMLRAVRDANASLDVAADSRGTCTFRIRSVDIEELWEDRAILTVNALRRIAGTPEFSDLLNVKMQIDSSDGGLRRFSSGEEEEWWSRLRINQDTPGSEMKFSLISNRARNEVERVEEPERAAAVIASAIQYPQTEVRVAQALFEMLVPPRLKEYAPELRRVVLMVDPNTARYPWELMQDRLGRSKAPLAVEAALVRQLEMETYRPAAQQSDTQTALVVGNPVTTPVPGEEPPGYDAKRPDFFPLPNARLEAEAVAESLTRIGVDVRSLVETRGADIRIFLNTDSYRILHFAGHGVQQYKSPGKKDPVNGMVIGFRDFLTPADIKGLRVMPELVFLNCCHLGRTDILAANLAVEFIGMGVRAVIAAGWAVDDAAGTTFAKAFYEAFLGRDESFGEAVREARERTYDKHRNVNTWGAYQCYGDFGYKFKSAGGSAPAPQPSMALLSQLTLALENLAQKSKAGASSAAQVRGELQQLRQAKGIDKSWWDKGIVWAALAAVQAELGDFDDAVKSYEAAAAADRADMPVRALEQMANIRARRAAQEFKTGMMDLTEFQSEIEKAKSEIQELFHFGKSTERLGIRASILKREALVLTGKKRVTALQSMTDSYLQSIPTKNNETQYTGQWLNATIGKVVLSWFQSNQSHVLSGEDLRHIGDYIKLGQKNAADDPKFWNAVIEPDSLLVKYLGNPPRRSDDAKELATIYRRARMQGASAREFASVTEHFEFLITMAADAAQTEIQEMLEYCLRFIKDDNEVWHPPARPVPTA